MPRKIDRQQRKAELAEALWRIVRDRGIGAVSVRSVAEEAGVVVGSLRHVFPTRAGLLLFSAELMVQRASDRIRATPRGGDVEGYALAVLVHLLPVSPESRAEMEVNVALIAEAPALPQLAAVRDDAQRQLSELCIHLVEQLSGRERDADVVRAGHRLHALVDGLALHLLTQPTDVDPAWAMDVLRTEVAQLSAQGSPTC